MDQEHEAALARILSQREKRGHLLDRRSVTGRKTNATADAQDDERYQRELEALNRQQQYVQQPQQSQSQSTRLSLAPQHLQQPQQAQTSFNQQQALLTDQAQQLLSQQQQLGQERQRLAAIQEQQNALLDQQRRGQMQQQPALSVGSSLFPQQQQQQMRGAAPPLSSSSNINNNAQQPHNNNNDNTNSNAAAAAAAAASGFAQLFEKGKFANFRESPVIATKDIRTIRPYVKGQSGANSGRSIINFGDSADSNSNNPAAAGFSTRTSTSGGSNRLQQQQQQQQQQYADEEDVNNISHVAASVVAGGGGASGAPHHRSISQQRYPAAAAGGGGVVGRTPSAAQLTSQARYALGGGSVARSLSGGMGGPGGVASGARSASKSAVGGGGGAGANNNNGSRTRIKNPVVDQLQRELTNMNARISENNPFRTQTLSEYLARPDESNVPADVLQVLRAAQSPTLAVAASAPVWNHKGEQLAAPMEGATVQAAPNPWSAMFNFTTACTILVKGDWFLKWTRVVDKVHRRHFRVSPDGVLLMWGMAEDTAQALAKIIRIQDIASIEPSSVVDESTDATTYVMTIWSAARVLQIGTEYREKFDIWYETLRLLAERQRKQNHAFSGRHATMVPESQTAAATSMVMRKSMMGGRVSSTD